MRKIITVCLTILFVLSTTEIAFTKEDIHKEASVADVWGPSTFVLTACGQQSYSAYITPGDRLKIYSDRIEIIRKTGEKIIIDLN